MDPDQDRDVRGDGVVLGHVLQQELQGAGDDHPGKVLFPDGFLHGNAFGETDFQQVVIHRHERDLLVQADELFPVVLQHVAVDAGQFVDVPAGFFLLAVLDDGIQDVQGVEQEMRVHLVLEGHVTVFRQMTPLPLGAQFVPDVHGVFDQVGESEDRHLHQQGDDDVPGKGGEIDGERPVEGEPEGVQQGAEDGGQADEQRRADGGDVQTVMLVVPGPDEEEGADEHRQEHQGVPEEGPEGADDVHALERRAAEDEQFDEQAQGENGDDREHQPADVFLPGTPRAGGGIPGAGEQVQRPSDDLGGQEGGEDVVDDFRGEIEKLGAEVAQHVSQDVHEDDDHGRELHGKVPPQADEHGEHHRQEGEDERIRPAEEGAQGDSRDVQRREAVNEPAGPDPFHNVCKIRKKAV